MSLSIVYADSRDYRSSPNSDFQPDDRATTFVKVSADPDQLIPTLSGAAPSGSLGSCRKQDKTGGPFARSYLNICHEAITA